MGIVSSEQDDDVICDIVLRSCISLIGLKEASLPLGLSTLPSMAPLAVATALMPARIFKKLFSKKEANSSLRGSRFNPVETINEINKLYDNLTSTFRNVA